MITYAISTPFTYLGPFDAKPATGESWQAADGKWYQIDQSKENDNALQREIESNIVAEIAQEYGSHPAVMGFVIGNEQNNAVTRGNCQFWAWINSIAARVKQAAPNKLAATTIVDDNFLTVKAAIGCNVLNDLDVWGINAYRGRVDVGFDNLFTDFAANAPQALLITEFGCPSSTRDASNNYIMMPQNSKSQGDYLKVHWDDIVAHNTICSGGYAFSWVDEWWKLGNPSTQDQDDARNGAFPGTYADEESYGLVALNVDCDKINDWATRVDQALPRAVYFIMGQMFGAWTEIPAQAYQPINYPRCNGKWVGDSGSPNAATPVDPQQPVAAVPTTTTTPETTTTPTTVDPQEPTTVTTPVDVTNPPSVIAAPIDGTGNQNANSASSVACSVAVMGLSIIALVL